jgi:hypothetical protein
MTTFFLLFDEQDEPYIRALQQHLQPLVRQAMLEVLNVADIPASADKDSETASGKERSAFGWTARVGSLSRTTRACWSISCVLKGRECAERNHANPRPVPGATCTAQPARRAGCSRCQNRTGWHTWHWSQNIAASRRRKASVPRR